MATMEARTPDIQDLDQRRAYLKRSLRLYKWIDLLSSITDGYVVCHILFVLDVTQRSMMVKKMMAVWLRYNLTIKMAIHLIIVPLLTFSGSLGSMIKALAMDSKDEVIASFSAAGNDGPNLDRTKINATRAKTVWKYMAWTKIKFLLNAFAMVTFTAFLLTLDNSPGVLMDLVLMSAYFTVICFATPVHFIYFPAGATFGQKPGDPEVIDYPSVPRLLVLHVLVMMIGWSIGNYVAMLDWDPPYMHFPNCNMLGLCAGHLLSGLLAVVAIRT